MTLNNQLTRTRTDPPVMLDAAYVERLEGMAMAIKERDPEVTERLLQEIERSQVVPSAELPPDVVTIGSRMTFIDESTRQEQTVTVVFPPDADIAERRVSVLTPIGAALIGLARGASIGWETRTGQRRELTVIAVSPPQSNGSMAAEAS
jgi:regulator of nucleoside diphosphate kinase